MKCILSWGYEADHVEECGLEGEMTHWMHVDWMVAKTPRAACHCLLEQIVQSVRNPVYPMKNSLDFVSSGFRNSY